MNQTGSVLLIMLVLIFLIVIGGAGVWIYSQQSTPPVDPALSTVDTEIEFRPQISPNSESTDYTQVQENYNLNPDQLEILSRVDDSRL